MKGILLKFSLHLRMRQCLFFALPDIIDALVVSKKMQKGRDKYCIRSQDQNLQAW